jgi:CRISPR system Cascade subunit CasC
MLANNHKFDRTAAMQVAHPFTTHRCVVEDDYFSAVDDLQPHDETGAGHINTQYFAAGVFYGYASIDVDRLIKNLGGNADELARNAELAGIACGALAEAMATTVPSGKQNSFAAFARASYVLVERGTQQPRTLANAFTRGMRGTDLITDSIAALRRWRDQMTHVYGKMVDASAEMNVGAVKMNKTGKMDVEAGTGRLADIVAFCQEAVQCAA